MSEKVERHAMGAEDYIACSMRRLAEFTKLNGAGGGDFKTKGTGQRHKECGLRLFDSSDAFQTFCFCFCFYFYFYFIIIFQ